MTGQDLYQRLTEICTQMAQGDYEQAKTVFDLLPSDDVNDPVNVLVEAFSMMLVRTEAREFELSRLLTELEVARTELLRHQERLLSENDKLRGELKRKAAKEKKLMHLSQSAAMMPVIQQVERAAAVDCTLLFTGETGTGKSIFAKHIHSLSSRSNKPFVTINCAAIPATLLESELFGIEEGVASGVKARMGRFEQAGGGTIFLDEIGDMPLESQAKLLHVVENGFVERIGGRKIVPIDVRIMAATCRDLERSVQERTFREDLFYRLNVMHVHIPPLRERREDIPLLVKHIYGQYAQQNPLAVTQVSREAMALMTQYAWPGNVRELANELERASLLTTGSSICPEDLSFAAELSLQNQEVPERCPVAEAVHAAVTQTLPHVHSVTPDVWVHAANIPSLQDVENAYIIKVMDFLNNNKSRTAKTLGISREGLRVKLERMKKSG